MPLPLRMIPIVVSLAVSAGAAHCASGGFSGLGYFSAEETSAFCSIRLSAEARVANATVYQTDKMELRDSLRAQVLQTLQLSLVLADHSSEVPPARQQELGWFLQQSSPLDRVKQYRFCWQHAQNAYQFVTAAQEGQLLQAATALAKEFDRTNRIGPDVSPLAR